MKEVIVKNEFDRSYLLIDGKEIEESYEFKMLLQNRIPGLLDCKIRYFEEISYLAYDITSKKALEKDFADRKMGFQDLVELFYGINSAIKKANEYLLKPEGFLLYPQYMFRDLETEELECLYFPDFREKTDEKKETYRQLADFLLDRVDHKDEHAVNITYHFYKISKEEFFSFETFVSFMEKEAALVQAKERREKFRVDEKDVTNVEKEKPEEINETMDWEESGKTEKFQPKWWVPGILFVLGAVLIILYLVFPSFHQKALYILIPGLTVIVTAILLVIRYVVLLYKRNSNEEDLDNTEPVRVEEYFDDALDDVTVFFDQEEYLHLKWKEGRFSKEHILEAFPATVGKLKESVQIEINDPSISRLHARFRKQGNSIYLQDLDSTNGTFVNEKRLHPGEDAIINRGDEIQFGKIIVNVV